MNVKRASAIFIFTLFLILSASSVYALDNSTDSISQKQDDEFISDNETAYEGFSYYDDFAQSLLDEQWVIDENGNIIIIPSTKEYSFENFSADTTEKNHTDLRNNIDYDIDLNQSYPPISSSGRTDSLWNEFIKDHWAFMEKRNSLPTTVTIDEHDYVQNNPCNTRHGNALDGLMTYIKTTAKPAVIESMDISVLYSRDNVYKVRILNPYGDPVAKGINVTFLFNGKKIHAKTNDNGYASFKFNCQAGNYVVNIYAGDISSKNKITVKALFKTKNIQKKYKKSSKFKIKLIKQNGKSVSKKNIKITLNSKIYKVKSNLNGISTFNIPKNLKIGKYTIKTSYNGCVVENKITVKK